MDLDLDAATEEFRDEVRDWLAANVPAEPLPPMDTDEGFEPHREWERTLAQARLSTVTWPREFGGRDATLLQWVVFEDEYYAAGGPSRVSANGIALLGSTLMAFGTDEQKQRDPPPHVPRRRHLGAGLVRAGGGQRPGRRAQQGRAHRRGLAPQWTEDLELAGEPRRPCVRAVPE